MKETSRDSWVSAHEHNLLYITWFKFSIPIKASRPINEHIFITQIVSALRYKKQFKNKLLILLLFDNITYIFLFHEQTYLLIN